MCSGGTRLMSRGSAVVGHMIRLPVAAMPPSVPVRLAGVLKKSSSFHSSTGRS